MSAHQPCPRPRPTRAIDAHLSAFALVMMQRKEGIVLIPTEHGLHLPGGKIERGETATRALRRELHEELGVPPELDLYVEPVAQRLAYYPNPSRTGSTVGGAWIEALYVVKVDDEDFDLATTARWVDAHENIMCYDDVNGISCAARWGIRLYREAGCYCAKPTVKERVKWIKAVANRENINYGW